MEDKYDILPKSPPKGVALKRRSKKIEIELQIPGEVPGEISIHA